MLCEIDYLLGPGVSTSRMYRGHALYWKLDKRRDRWYVTIGPQREPGGSGKTRYEALRDVRALIDKQIAAVQLANSFILLRY